MAAISASQQKIIPSPRAKFSAKPPSGYSTSTPSSSGKSSVVGFGFITVTVRMPLSSHKSAGIGNSWNVSGARLIGPLRQKFGRSGVPTAQASVNVPDGLFCAELNFTRNCNGLPAMRSFAKPKSIFQMR